MNEYTKNTVSSSKVKNVTQFKQSVIEPESSQKNVFVLWGWRVEAGV